MDVTKLVITTETNERIQISAFNPKEYALGKKVNWKDTKGRGLTLAVPQFDGGSRSFALSVVYDSYELAAPNRDVRKLTKELVKLAEPPQGKKRPSICTVTWGADPPADSPYTGLPFTGVVEGVTQKFTLFDPDGTPVRATVDVSFKEVKSPVRQEQENPSARTNPLEPKTRVTKEGDSLWSIAAAEYGDPARWRPIAEANGITNPRELPAGLVLLIPSIP